MWEEEKAVGTGIKECESSDVTFVKSVYATSGGGALDPGDALIFDSALASFAPARC